MNWTKFTTALAAAAAVAGAAAAGDWRLLALGLLLAFYAAGTWNYDFFRRRGLASTRPRVPFFGDFFSSLLGREAFTDSVQRMYDEGAGHAVFGTFEMQNPVLMIRDPDLVKQVTVKDFDFFMNHQTFGSEKNDPLLGKSLFNLKDHTWRNMRGTLSPAFTTSKIKSMLPTMSKCGEQMIQHLRQKCLNSTEGSQKQSLPVDTKDLFTRLANDIIATIAFGLSCDSLGQPENEFYHMGKVMTDFSKKSILIFLASTAFPKLVEMLGLRMLDGRATNYFDSLVRETVAERQRRGIQRPDVLQLLMQAREGSLRVDAADAAEAEKLGARRAEITQEDMSAQAVIFFFAGFNTVSTALCFTTHLLSHHPDVQRRVQQEIESVLEENGGQHTYEGLQKMKYLDATINEALRMYPPVPSTDRVCTRDIAIPTGGTPGAVTIRKDARISIPFVGLHYDPQYWEEPEKFDPERFSEENKHKIKPFTYMPFGIGPRICVAQRFPLIEVVMARIDGARWRWSYLLAHFDLHQCAKTQYPIQYQLAQRFALIEVKMALAHLLAHFDLHPCAKTKHPLEYVPGGSITVRGGFWCELTARSL